MLTKTKVATQTVTVNAAFLEEVKEVNLELWNLLRQTSRYLNDASQVPLNSHRLLGQLVRLQDNLAMHFALEEFYGYFDDPLAVEPRLSESAADLRQEHGLLYLQLCDLIDFVEEHLHRRNLSGVLRTVRHRYGAFMDQFVAHETRERELILEAYEEDIGTGD